MLLLDTLSNLVKVGNTYLRLVSNEDAPLSVILVYTYPCRGTAYRYNRSESLQSGGLRGRASFVVQLCIRRTEGVLDAAEYKS